MYVEDLSLALELELRDQEMPLHPKIRASFQRCVGSSKRIGWIVR